MADSPKGKDEKSGVSKTWKGKMVKKFKRYGSSSTAPVEVSGTFGVPLDLCPPSTFSEVRRVFCRKCFPTRTMRGSVQVVVATSCSCESVQFVRAKWWWSLPTSSPSADDDVFLLPEDNWSKSVTCSSRCHSGRFISLGFYENCGIFAAHTARGGGVHADRGGARDREPGHLPGTRQHGRRQRAAGRTEQGTGSKLML